MKILLLMSLFIMVSTSAFGMNTDAIRTATLCQDGYKFLLVYAVSGSNRPPTVVQIFESNGSYHNPPQPMKCAGPDRILGQ